MNDQSGETSGGPVENTDRELWREREGDYYADSIHVTQGGGIGMNCGGYVVVQPIRKWHGMAQELSQARAVIAKQERELAEAKAKLGEIAWLIEGHVDIDDYGGPNLAMTIQTALANEKGDGERHRCQHCGNYDCEHHQSKGDGDGGGAGVANDCEFAE